MSNYKAEVVGKLGIRVRLVAASTNLVTGQDIFTIEARYPRFIHGELMTHRVFSRNASSSRAIPVRKMNANILDHPAWPHEWSKNKPGMQATEEISDDALEEADEIWQTMMELSVQASQGLADLKVHKQHANRLTEPFQFIDTIITATEWGNFFDLRLDASAQPEFQELASLIKLVVDGYEPDKKMRNEWHLPYILPAEFSQFRKDHLALISAGRCARVSYKNHDGTTADPKKDLELARMLKESQHMSPFEHQAIALGIGIVDFGLEDFDEILEGFRQPGVTHIDNYGDVWSGNFQHWAQHRQLL